MANTLTLALENGLEITLQVPAPSEPGKETTGWIVFMKTYAHWCKSPEGIAAAKDAGLEKIVYDTKEVG